MKKKECNYFGELLAECPKHTDRAVAILLGAELDELLLKILQKRFLPKSKKNTIDLLSSTGPLGSFAAKIEIAFRLGIIDKIFAHDLHSESA